MQRWPIVMACALFLSAGLLFFIYFGTGPRPDIRVVISSNITIFDSEYTINPPISEAPITRRRSGISVDIDLMLRNKKNRMTVISIDCGIVNKTSGKKVSGGGLSRALEPKETRNEDIIFDLETTPILSTLEDFSFRIILIGKSLSGQETWYREKFFPVPGVSNYRI